MNPMLTRREMILAIAAAAVAAPAWAADDTFKGELVCAKCFLKKPDAKECQDVLLVKDASGATTEYYITKNKVALESGEACTQKIPAVVVGSVSEKDGRKWLTASKITKS
jgi:Na+-transporting NADH:ubiquinone oxidoreductase subunit NqrB